MRFMIYDFLHEGIAKLIGIIKRETLATPNPREDDVMQAPEHYIARTPWPGADLPADTDYSYMTFV